MIRGANRFQSFDQLFQRLKEYPKDLDDLYCFLCYDIEPRYAADAAFWLLTTLYTANDIETRRFEPNASYMSYAEDYDLHNEHWLAQRVLESRKGTRERAKQMQQRMHAQSPHFFDFSANRKHGRGGVFSLRAVLDFLCKNDNAIVKDLHQRVKPGKIPELSGVALPILHEISQWVRREDDWIYEDWIYNLTIISHKFLQQGQAAPVFLLLDQLVSLFAKIKLDRRARFPDHPSLTQEGWAFETIYELFERIDHFGGRLLHIFALQNYYFDHGHVARMINEMANILEYDDDARGLLILESLWNARDNTYKLSDDKVQSYDVIEKILSNPLPDGMAGKVHSCRCLCRILELARNHLCSEGEGYYPKLLSNMRIIYSLMKRGADPNAICKAVSGNPNKSHM